VKFFVLIAFLVFSCAGGPKPVLEQGTTSVPQAAFTSEQAQSTNEEHPPVDQSIAESGAEEEQPVPITQIPVTPPEESIIADALPEPQIELPDVIVFSPPPRETVVIAALPEPTLPALPPVPEPVIEAPVQIPTRIPEPVQPPAVQTPPAPAPRPPEMRPPNFLGPAEERPPVTVTETVPHIPSPPAPVFPAQEASPLFAPERESLNDQIVFSRTVRATVGQIVEIPFRGTGWVYLGELASRRGIVYNSRRLDPEGQTFIFRAEESGTYALKFYKQDFVRDFILNDYVQVLVGEAPVASGSGWFNPPLDRGRVIAEPRWPTSLEEAELRRSAESTTGTPAVRQSEQASPPRPTTATVIETEDTQRVIAPVTEESPIQTVPEQPVIAAAPAVSVQPVMPPAVEETVIPAGSPPEAYLQKAKELFDEGRVVSAIGLLDKFRESYPSGSDEAYWLYGQFYEANTPSRDILTALDYYRRLVREYPQSSRLNDARRRIAYLERFYINIQ